MMLLLLSIGLVGVFFLLMSVRMLLLRKGEFRGTCSSNSPWLVKNGEKCNYCGRKEDDDTSCPREKVG